MPDIELVQARKAWLQPLLTQLRENYKTICQNGALVAVGAVAALLVVSFAHRRSPLPAGLQGAEKVGAGSAFIQTSTNQSPAKANGSGRR